MFAQCFTTFYLCIHLNTQAVIAKMNALLQHFFPSLSLKERQQGRAELSLPAQMRFCGLAWTRTTGLNIISVAL